MTVVDNCYDYTFSFSYPLTSNKTKENSYLLSYNFCFTSIDYNFNGTSISFSPTKKIVNVNMDKTDFYITLSISNQNKDVYIQHLNECNQLVFINYLSVATNHNFNHLAKNILSIITDNFVYTNLKQNLLDTLPVIFQQTRSRLIRAYGI